MTLLVLPSVQSTAADRVGVAAGLSLLLEASRDSTVRSAQSLALFAWIVCEQSRKV